MAAAFLSLYTAFGDGSTAPAGYAQKISAHKISARKTGRTGAFRAGTRGTGPAFNRRGVYRRLSASRWYFIRVARPPRI